MAKYMITYELCDEMFSCRIEGNTLKDVVNSFFKDYDFDRIMSLILINDETI